MYKIKGYISPVDIKKGLFIAILLLASFLRLYNLANVPPSASLDEASIGYNAYSVLKTGGDEYGNFPLISQRGYDDYRRSTYLLLVIPFVALLNLTVLAVRLPAVILSVVTVWATYEIALMFFPKRTIFSDAFALVSMLLLAISPWHIYISRLGHESNACLSFLVIGVLFFLKGLKNTKLLYFSAFFLILSMISYYSGQIVIPLLVIGLFVLYGKMIFPRLIKNKRYLYATGIMILIIIPIVWSVFSPDALIRYRGTSTFSPDVHSEMFSEMVSLRNKAVANHDLIGAIVNNRRLFFVRVFLEGYISHFQPGWLFTNPSQGSFKAPNMGLLYIWEFPFIILGFIFLVFSKKVDKRIKALVLLWFFIAPIAPSVATQAPHAMRDYNSLPTWQFLSAFGIISVVFLFDRLKVIMGTIVLLFGFFGLMAFCYNYYVLFPVQQSRSFQYALAQTVPVVVANAPKYRKIIISNKDNLYQSYMLYLFHSRYNPVSYQKQGGTKSGGYNETHEFGKYEFRPIVWNKENKDEVLFVGNPGEIPDAAHILFEGKYLDGSVGTKVAVGN